MQFLRSTNTRKERVLRVILIVLIIATLAFIFGNSTLTAEKSGEQSSAVTDVIVGALPTDKQPVDIVAKNDFHQNLRKVAHFAEYGLLGAEIALFLVLFAQRLTASALLSPIIALLVSFVDESIQMLTDRTPSVMDMWIDIAGFAAFSVLIYALCLIVKARPVSRLIKFITSRKK